MEPNSKILVTGSTGMVGSALIRQLEGQPYTLLTPGHGELDLRHQTDVLAYFRTHQPDYVFHLAAIVGGIHANQTYPAKFIYDNTQMHCNIIQACHTHAIKKLLFPGSACTYPKLAPQPIQECSFLNGMIEPTNLAYAAAKINGIVMCQAYAREHGLNVVIPMPTNAYGIGDNFDPAASHVIPALMKRFHDAKMAKRDAITLFGTGTPLREFIYVDDLAKALLFIMQRHDNADILNVGTMQEISILALAKKIANVVGFEGDILTDASKPDGAPRKCLNTEKLFSLGFQPETSLPEGLKKMYHHHFISTGQSRREQA